MGVIYQIVVAGGDRTYIGSAVRMPYRKASHLSLLRKGTHHCRALQGAINAHGVDSISWTTLEVVDDDQMLIEREQAWLDLHAGKLYNKSPTAASRLGAIMSKEACAKISASLQGNQYRKGIKHGPEDRAKISEGVRAAYASGKRKPTPQPENLREYNEACQRGERKHPRINIERDALIVADHAVTKSMRKTGKNFNLSSSAIGYAVKRHHERKALCPNI